MSAAFSIAFGLLALLSLVLRKHFIASHEAYLASMFGPSKNDKRISSLFESACTAIYALMCIYFGWAA